jgi:hypothetical protein
MTATTTRTTEGTTRPDDRFASMDPATLRDWAHRTRSRAEELMLRSASVLAHAGDLQAQLGTRSERAADDDPRVRLVDAEARIANLERALASNRRIGMALGVLMARRGLTEEQAFDLLRQQSSLRNVKLVTIADEVVYTGDL